jgi:hypothetical protein
MDLTNEKIWTRLRAAISSYKQAHPVLLAIAEFESIDILGYHALPRRRGPSSTLQTETQKGQKKVLSSVVAMHMGDVLPIRGANIIAVLRNVQTKNRHWVKWDASEKIADCEADQARIYLGKNPKNRRLG